MAKQTATLQQYPRKDGLLLAVNELFPVQRPPLDRHSIQACINLAYKRCLLKKSGSERKVPCTPEKLVETCLEHLRTRSDPILSPYFVSLCDPASLFELDAVSHEMQRHRMTIGVFYQYLLLELMRKNGRFLMVHGKATSLPISKHLAFYLGCACICRSKNQRILLAGKMLLE